MEEDAEDVYFVLGCMRMGMRVGDDFEAARFAVHMQFPEDCTFFGIHQPWPNIIDYLKDRLPHVFECNPYLDKNTPISISTDPESKVEEEESNISEDAREIMEMIIQNRRIPLPETEMENLWDVFADEPRLLRDIFMTIVRKHNHMISTSAELVRVLENVLQDLPLPPSASSVVPQSITPPTTLPPDTTRSPSPFQNIMPRNIPIKKRTVLCK
jgi:hypothetical protein